MAYGANAYRGKWKPRNPAKYRGNIHSITYRSSWELKAFNWCDTRSNVLTWSSEETIIPYKSPVDGQIHRYFVDLKFTIRNKDGSVSTYLAEIKPKKFTEKPTTPTRKSKRYLEECIMFATNEAKWEAAKKFCDRKGWKFIVLTEKELGIK
jgi:hypothetical protein